MGLNAKQKEAVEYLDGPLLVLAGPGTGKTQLLSEKVAFILKNTDTNPENLLCLTFTETGASNMRERLKSIIGKEGLKVNIGTYHAFGIDILTQYKNYAEDYGRRLDSAIDEVTQYKIISEIQSKLPARDILRGDNVKDIISVISSAKSARLSADDLAKIAEQNIADSGILSDAISPLLQNIVPRNYKASFENAYQPIYEILSRYVNVEPILPGVERIIAGLSRGLKDAIVEAECSEKISPLSKWKDTYFEKSESGNYRLKDRVANKKLSSIARIMRAYDDYLRENALYDFDDMIQEAVRILTEDKGFRLSLQERYQYIMLDEFQDTNPSQFAIIKQLTDYEKPMIMAVGDDDQAIYEFQGALSTNLTDFQEHYEANVIPLVENYRSTQEILDFSRKVINQASDRFADKELIAHKPGPDATQIYRYEFLSSDMEYDYVSKEISRLIKAGVRQSDIAIISYKTKYFMPLLPYLKAQSNINIAYEKQDNLLEDEIVHEILSMARFAYNIKNERRTDMSVMEILAYPFWKLPMLDIVKTVSLAKAQHKDLLESLTESSNPEVAKVVTWLIDLAGKAFVEPLEIVIDYIIGALELNNFTSPMLEYYTTDNDYKAFVLYENLAALRGKLRRHFGDKSLKLDDLISMIDEYESAEIPINKTSPYKDADDAVQVLSAHKAKGLEFEYVFIISTDHMAWGKGKGNNNLLALPKNLIQIRHTGTTDGEKLRVLYVALTRAKGTLYITNSLHDFNGKTPDRLEYLEEYVDGNVIKSPLIPSNTVTCFYDSDTWCGSDTTGVERIKHWLRPYAELNPDMQVLYRERIDRWRMSASSLTSFIDIAYSGPIDFFKRYVLCVPSEPETEAMAFGDLIHKTFEAVTNKHISNEEAVEYFLAELDKKELPQDVLQRMREKGPEDLSVSLHKFGKILRQGKAEVDFAPDKLMIGSVPVTGKIDHILIDDDTKAIEIYDFKTGGYHKEKWSSHATLYKYMLQLGFYKLLLNNSLIYRRYKVERAHILFVTPDKDDEVYDKVYEFNEKDEDELLQIMEAVYNNVKTLDFLRDKEVFRMADNSLGIKDIKGFIELLLAKNPTS